MAKCKNSEQKSKLVTLKIEMKLPKEDVDNLRKALVKQGFSHGLFLENELMTSSFKRFQSMFNKLVVTKKFDNYIMESIK